MEEVEARDVIRLQVVRSAAELDRGRALGKSRFEFTPNYVHQIFESETIRGHESPLLIMKFAAHSLFLYGPEFISIRQAPDADNPVEKLIRFLPADDDFRTDDLEMFKKKLAQPFSPIGKLISTYSCVEKPNETPVEFQIRKADFSMKGVRKFHERLRFLAMCFIETASFIDDRDEKWSLLLLYRKRQPGESPNHAKFADIVGYVTLYAFYAHPGGKRLRLSQIVILPPYQRNGHGRKLLLAVYDEASRRNSFEVTVEDPAPSFQRLRDQVDLEKIIKGRYFESDDDDGNDSPSKKRKRQSTFNTRLEKWDASYAAKIRNEEKIHLGQIRRIYEMLKLHRLQQDGNDESWTEFRLEVKRRLQKEHIGNTKKILEERKRILASLYDELVDEYNPILAKLFHKP